MNNKISSTNPANGYREIGSLFITTNDEIQKIAQLSKQSFRLWKKTFLKSRLSFVQEIHDSFVTRINEVAEMQTLEIGKPITESIAECNSIAKRLQWYIANAADILKPQLLDRYDSYFTELCYEPYGVSAVIAPWNFPTYLMLNSSIQALIAGNTVIFKHSEECPLTSKLIQDIIDSTNLPKGVFQTIYGGSDVGKLLLEQDINFVSFTGSSRAGEAIFKKAAEKFIPSLLEMGGSSPGIIFPDANIDTTCESVFQKRFTNCGQVCTALKRLIVHEDIFDSVVSKLLEISKTQVIGNPINESTTIGSLAAKRQLELLDTQVKDAIKKGAKVVCGGISLKDLDGAFYSPTILTNVSNDMRVLKEEVFGPVLPIVKYSSTEEAIKIANDTPYGLSAFVYTSNMELANKAASSLEAGQISINGTNYNSDSAPFGGYKKSGIGRIRGKEGFYSVSQTKVVAKPL